MKICKIEDCENVVCARDYCRKHYTRWWRYGDPHYTKFMKNVEKHGMGDTTEYQSWYHMKDRCYNKDYNYYHRYGGRGITICDRWKNSFNAFFVDMGSKPFPKAQIDRIDNDGNYEPGNCRWTTSAQNSRNRSNNKLTIEKAKEIRNKHKAGNITQIKLGCVYGISRSMINYIINNKNWV